MTKQSMTKRLRNVVLMPQMMVLSGFAGGILLGAILLVLPWSHVPGRVSFLDALFTSASAVCVTGLAVVDTGKDYTSFGQWVILILIQAGGLGVMTFAALTFEIMGRRMSLRSQAVLHETFFQQDMAQEFRRTFKNILLLTLIIETAGCLTLFLFLAPRMDDSCQAAFSSLFHAVSAFCNAGFSLNSDNLMGLRDSPGPLFCIMTLIVAGGLGFTVLNELYKELLRVGRGIGPSGPNRFSYHARLVMRVSALLILGGTVCLILFGMTPDENSWPVVALNALFQSVTSRTAGFNSVDIGRLPSSSLFILIVLMFIGGSPGSCAGGIKTTSASILWARLVSGLRGYRDVRLMGRTLPHELVSRTDLLVALALFWNMAGVLFLLRSEAGLGVDTLHLVFEQVSAFGTVGLSAGLTPDLSISGKLWIIATMFVGRLGPLTIALSMISPAKADIRYPKGTVMIG